MATNRNNRLTTDQQMSCPLTADEVVFVCERMDCDKRFRTKKSLTEHRRYHLCGFRCDGRHDDRNECSDQRLSQLSRPLPPDGGLKRYECLVCRYVGHLSEVLKHIHNRHVCRHWTHDMNQNDGTAVGAANDRAVARVGQRDDERPIDLSLKTSRSANSMDNRAYKRAVELNNAGVEESPEDIAYERAVKRAIDESIKSVVERVVEGSAERAVVNKNWSQITHLFSHNMDEDIDRKAIGQKNMKTFRCHECDKSFTTRSSLSEHQKNHLCGFGIKPLADDQNCSERNIRKYWAIVSRNPTKCLCLWTDCGYEGDIHNMKRHVHNLHVCPHRKNSSEKAIKTKANKCETKKKDKLAANDLKSEAKRENCFKVPTIPPLKAIGNDTSGQSDRKSTAIPKTYGKAIDFQTQRREEMNKPENIRLLKLFDEKWAPILDNMPLTPERPNNWWEQYCDGRLDSASNDSTTVSSEANSHEIWFDANSHPNDDRSEGIKPSIDAKTTDRLCLIQ